MKPHARIDSGDLLEPVTDGLLPASPAETHSISRIMPESPVPVWPRQNRTPDPLAAARHSDPETPVASGAKRPGGN